jgi:hypothetical protein
MKVSPRNPLGTKEREHVSEELAGSSRSCLCYQEVVGAQEGKVFTCVDIHCLMSSIEVVLLSSCIDPAKQVWLDPFWG